MANGFDPPSPQAFPTSLFGELADRALIPASPNEISARIPIAPEVPELRPPVLIQPPRPPRPTVVIQEEDEAICRHMLSKIIFFVKMGTWEDEKWETRQALSDLIEWWVYTCGWRYANLMRTLDQYLWSVSRPFEPDPTVRAEERARAEEARSFILGRRAWTRLEGIAPDLDRLAVAGTPIAKDDPALIPILRAVRDANELSGQARGEFQKGAEATSAKMLEILGRAPEAADLSATDLFELNDTLQRALGRK